MTFKYVFFSCFLWGCCAGLLLTGCSTVVNSHRQKQSMMNAYMGGNYEAAEKAISPKLARFSMTSAVNTGDELVWRLESGSLHFHRGNFAESLEEFTLAEQLIASYDERAAVSLRDAGAEAGAALTNLNALPYRGFCRDRIALAVYKSLAYLGNDREDSFRAQVRRLRNEQKKVQQDYEKIFLQEQAQTAAARKKNPEAARKAQSFSTDGGKLANHPRNRQFTAELAQVRKVAHQGYAHFLNPAAIFLSGLVSLRDGNPDNARIDFQHLYEAMPLNPMIRQYYVTCLKQAGRPVPTELQEVKPFAFPVDKDCVYVLFANGRGSSFKQIAIYFPIMTAWPVCQFYPAPFRSLQLTGGGKTSGSTLLADMDAIIAREYEERLPGMITRIILSTLIKEGAYYTGMVAASQIHDSTARTLAVTAVAVGGNVYRMAVNTADTRSWEMLPKEFQLAQLPMPADRKVQITFDHSAEHAREIRLPENCRSAIIYVSAPGKMNIVSHVLPLPSR